MHPIQHAETRPDHPAVIMAGSGETINYRQMDEAANRVAQLLRSRGLAAGDAIAVLMENSPRYYEIYWGTQRAGVILVPISTHLSASEVAYILRDSDARLLITTKLFDQLLAQMEAAGVDLPVLSYGGNGERSVERALSACPTAPVDDQSAGRMMLYSSGTTGRPKGIIPAPPADPAVQASTPLMMLAIHGFHFPADGSSVYLSSAPLYHAAPLGWSTSVHRLGGTVVVMEKFDPEGALAAIEKYRITESQWVPTHFVRLLKLSEEVRGRYDLSSHQHAIHAAAPCPVRVKRAMIDWWGPIIWEYYAGSESNGMTMVGSEDWLGHPGTVGRAILGTVHVCDPSGHELPVGGEGVIYFESPLAFAYHKDAEKTAEVTHARGWTTLGDIGRLDEDGFLYLTDRRSNMIISGGVNIYPQEIENLLIGHPKVMDAAVVGAPDAEMGECVVAVVQPVDMAEAGDALAAELRDYLSQGLARFKLPRLFDFRAELPREANGKLYKRKLKDEYLARPEPA